MSVLIANDVHFRHVGLELKVGQHAISLRSVMEVLKHLLFLGPNFPALGIGTLLRHTVLAPPNMEGPKLRLQLGALVGSGNPAITAYLVVAIKDNKVVVARLRIDHGGLQAVVPGTDHSSRMWPDMSLRPKRVDPLDRSKRRHLVAGAELADAAASLDVEMHTFWINAQCCAQRIFHISRACAGLDGKSDFVITTENSHGRCLEGGAILPTPWHAA
mmetsp:Transcript_25384/g.55450  ORF Transcript_25384/g.55450 Transcript_25384/m.55450 type:complete len:216 (+) Transcript_25384:1453-2100(+)